MTSVNVEVIDTHALVWYFENSPQLSPTARRSFDRIAQGDEFGVIPTIVLAELMHISEKRKTRLAFAEVLARLERNPSFRITSLDKGILIRMNNLPMFEIHDRIIVATALSFRARLITRDREIRDSGVVECIW